MPSRRVFKERILREAQQQVNGSVLNLTTSFAALGAHSPVVAGDSFPVLTASGTARRSLASTLRTYVLGISGGTATIPENLTVQGTTIAFSNATSFIVGADRLRVENIANDLGTEWTTWNPSGSVMGGLPTNTATSLLVSGDGVRALTTARVIRVGNLANIIGLRANGSLSSPTGVLSGDAVASFSANANSATNTIVDVGSFVVFARENISASSAGSQAVVFVNDVGSATPKIVNRFRGGGTNVAEWDSSQSTTRIISGSTGIAFRDSTNASDTFTVNAAGTTVAYPLATNYSVGTMFQASTISNATSTEVSLWNPTGTVMGGLPTNTALAVLGNGDGGRFATRVRIIRAGNTPFFAGIRVNGSLDAPTQTLATQTLVGFGGNAYTDTGTVVQVVDVSGGLRENATASAAGSFFNIQVADIGSVTVKSILRFQGGGTNIAELVSGQSTLRIIPGATGIAYRDSGNTADTFTVNAAGTAVTFPLATSLVIGTDPTGSQLLRVGGDGHISGQLTFNLENRTSDPGSPSTGRLWLRTDL